MTFVINLSLLFVIFICKYFASLNWRIYTIPTAGESFFFSLSPFFWNFKNFYAISSVYNYYFIPCNFFFTLALACDFTRVCLLASSLISWALLSIQTDISNAVILMVSILPQISGSSWFFSKHLRTVPSIPTTTGITMTFIFHSLFVLFYFIFLFFYFFILFIYLFYFFSLLSDKVYVIVSPFVFFNFHSLSPTERQNQHDDIFSRR